MYKQAMYDIISGDGDDIDNDQVEAFRNFCDIRVECAPGGKQCLLTASCGVQDSTSGEIRNFEETVDISPLIAIFGQKIKEAHARLHGEDPYISGPLDFLGRAARAARRVGENAAVRRVAQAAAVVTVPELALAFNAHDTLVQAKDGDEDAAMRLALVREMADAGDPKAKQVLAQLRVMNAALATKEAKADASVGGFYEIGKTDRKYGKAKGKNHRGRGRGRGRGGSGYGAGVDSDRALAEAQQTLAEAQDRQMAALAIQQAEAARQQSEADYITALSMQEQALSEREAHELASQLTEDADRAAAYESIMSYDPIDTAVSGWLYNSPYRSNLEALAQDGMLSLGTAARAMYNTGLGK